MKLWVSVMMLLLGSFLAAPAMADEGKRAVSPAAPAYVDPGAVQRSALDAPVNAKPNDFNPAAEAAESGGASESADPARDRKAGAAGGERSNPAQQEPLFLLLLQILRTPK